MNREAEVAVKGYSTAPVADEATRQGVDDHSLWYSKNHDDLSDDDVVTVVTVKGNGMVKYEYLDDQGAEQTGSTSVQNFLKRYERADV